MLSRTPGRFAVLFILVTILLDAITFGILVPVLPALITELTGEPLGKAATYNGLLMFIHAFMQFIFAPIFGNLSDRFGMNGGIHDAFNLCDKLIKIFLDRSY